MRVLCVVALMMCLAPSGAMAQDRAGATAYSRVCRACHGASGNGGNAPSLVPMTRGVGEVLAIVREGFGQMPPISASELSDAEVGQVVEYLKIGRTAPVAPVIPPPPASADAASGGTLMERIESAGLRADLGVLGRLVAEASEATLQARTDAERRDAHFAASVACWQYVTNSPVASSHVIRMWMSQAEDHLGVVLQLDPTYAEGHALLALVYGLQLAHGPRSDARYFRILKVIDEAERLGTKNPRVHLLLGITSATAPPPGGTGLDHAELELRRATQLFPMEPAGALWRTWGAAQANAWRGSVLARQIDVEGATESYQQALAVAPDFDWVRRVLLPTLPGR